MVRFVQARTALPWLLVSVGAIGLTACDLFGLVRG
jgi:hypothetical protein